MNLNNIKNRFRPYQQYIKNWDLFKNHNDILENIKTLHNNVHINQKSNILSLVAYDDLKYYLRRIKFNFCEKQFNIAKSKRIENEINLNNYKRFVPISKRKLNSNIIDDIVKYLENNSRIPSTRDFNIKYLEKSKKKIYLEYINDPLTTKITYNTFLKYSPKT